MNSAIVYVDIGFTYNKRSGSRSSGSTNDLTLSEFNIYAQEMIAKHREAKN
jgi:hypothetical protein